MDDQASEFAKKDETGATIDEESIEALCTLMATIGKQLGQGRYAMHGKPLLPRVTDAMRRSLREKNALVV